MYQSTGPLRPPSSKLGCNQPQLPPYMEIPAPGLVVPVLVWMSTTPAVWNPYCAGRAPVIIEMLLAKRDSSAWPNTDSPSGNSTPLSRYCTLACSPRKWIWPKLSCATPGAWSRTWLRGAFAPWGMSWSDCGENV